jgi:hypothetical protein
MPTDLIKFLFHDSQILEDQDATLDELVAIFEELDEIESIEAKQTSLKDALATVGVEVDDDNICINPAKCCIHTNDAGTYRMLKQTLLSMTGLSTLSDTGWVPVEGGGDNHMSGEEPMYVIKFIQTTLPDPSSNSEEDDYEKLEKELEGTIENSREFNGFGGDDHVIEIKGPNESKRKVKCKAVNETDEEDVSIVQGVKVGSYVRLKNKDSLELYVVKEIKGDKAVIKPMNGEQKTVSIETLDVIA